VTPIASSIGRVFASAAVFIVAIEGARRIAIASGAVARPNPIVRSHRQPVPYLGGTALVLGWLALVVASWLEAGTMPSHEAVARAAGALALVVFGTWDDLRPFGPATKLAVQLLVSILYLTVVGPSTAWSWVFQLLVLVSLVNSYNLIDVMDGLLCVVSTVAIVALVATPGLVDSVLHREITIMVVGLCALFLFNRPPARIYSGDAGSLAIGFLIGTWVLAAGRRSGPLETLSLIGVCAAPALELLLLIPARLQKGLSPFRGSPDHFALRLQDQAGWNKWKVLAVTLALAAWFAVAPAIARAWPAPHVLALAIADFALGLAVWYALWRMPPPSKAGPAQPERAASK